MTGPRFFFSSRALMPYTAPKIRAMPAIAAIKINNLMG
jgi:hypothetical protein